MRILHSVSNMDRAGIETMLMNYYRRMDRELVQFDFLCNKPQIGDYDSEIAELGGRIFRTPGYKNVFNYMKFMKRLFARHPEYKIIEGHNGVLMAYALSGARLAGVPVRIAHAHSTSIPVDYKTRLKKTIKPVIKHLITDRWACSNAAGEFYFTKKIWNECPHRVIRNAIETEKFAFNPELRDALRKERRLENNFVVGHIGRLTHQKNHEKLIDVFAKIYDINKAARLVLVGTGELRESLEEKAKAFGLGEVVIFTGPQSNPEAWFNLFDVLVMPSHFEGLPVVGIEAQASGLPCIFSNTITDEVGITEGVKFLDKEADDELWAREALSFEGFERKDTTRDMVAAGYDINSEAKKLQGIYLSLDKIK